MPRGSPGSSTWAASSCIRIRCAPAISITPTSCASISIRAPASSWADVRRVALEVKALLDEMGLRGWPKTSGSRGMHVNVRIQPRWTFAEVRRAALALSRAVERRVPALATSKWWKEERHGVFLDYNQNAKDRTTCSAYSVRPLPDARVSDAASLGRGARLRAGRLHRASRSRGASRSWAIRTRAWTPRPDRSKRCSSWPQGRGRGSRRRAVAAALSQDGRRSAAGGAVARQDRRPEEAADQDAAARGRELARQGCRAGRSGAVEEQTPRSRRTARRRRRAGRFHARAIVHLDPHPGEPASRARRAAAAAGNARPR